MKFKLEDTEKVYSKFFKLRDQSFLTKTTCPTKVNAVYHLGVLL